MKITLTAWAASQFDPPPAKRTLLLWVAEGRIVPSPLKIGRTYYVDRSARHIAEVAQTGSLLSRLRAA